MTPAIWIFLQLIVFWCIHFIIKPRVRFRWCFIIYALAHIILRVYCQQNGIPIGSGVPNTNPFSLNLNIILTICGLSFLFYIIQSAIFRSTAWYDRRQKEGIDLSKKWYAALFSDRSRHRIRPWIEGVFIAVLNASVLMFLA